MSNDTDPFDFNRYLQQVVDNTLKNVHTSLPGVIESFDPSTQIASIQPLIKREFTDNNVADLPLLINCPVVFPRAGGYVFTLPVVPGDECMIIFTERSLDLWMQSGGTQQPLDTRRHSLSDAVAVLGLFSQPNKLSSFYTGGAEIRAEGASVHFRLSNAGIDILGDVNIIGDVDVTGDIDLTGTSTADVDHISGTISGKTHIHSDPQGGFVGPPI